MISHIFESLFVALLVATMNGSTWFVPTLLDLLRNPVREEKRS